MVKKIIKNKGGLHNRLSHRISLKPFPLGLCEQLAQSRGLVFSRKQLLEAYMVFGGVPYYWSLLQKGASVTQEIDRLIFSPDGELNDEFEMLYASLFKKPEPYIRVIELLARKKMGMTRKVTGTESAVHTIMVTTDGVVHNEEWGEIQSEVNLDNLFELK